MRVLTKRIAVLPLKDPEKVGSIFIPDVAKRRCDQGIVKYVGSEVKEVKRGDLVLFSGYSGQQVNLKSSIDSVSQSLIILEEEFIVAILHRQGEMEETIVPGLFLQDANGYFPATADIAIQFIQDAINIDKSITAFDSPKESGRGI